MPHPGGARALVFVDITDPNNAISGSARTKIRRQAMKDVTAAKKQRGGWISYETELDSHQLKRFVALSRPMTPVKQSSELVSGENGHNRVQIDADCTTSVAFVRSPTRYMHSYLPALPAPVLSITEDFAMLQLKSQFDILSLSALTTFETGRGTIQILAQRPDELKNILQSQYKQRSYFIHIPCRYGGGTCLDDAVWCVAHKAGESLLAHGPTSSRETIAFYVKALKSLNIALSDQSRQLDVDVLAATCILTLYEVRFCSVSTEKTICHEIRKLTLHGVTAYGR